MKCARINVELMDCDMAHAAGRAVGTWLWGLLWAKSKGTDILPRVCLRGSWAGERDALQHMAKLVEVGLARPVEGGWRLISYRPPRPRARGALRDRVIARDGLVCGICGGTVSTNDVHIDHVVALANGGSHEEHNLQVTHSICNQRKGAR